MMNVKVFDMSEEELGEEFLKIARKIAASGAGMGGLASVQERILKMAEKKFPPKEEWDERHPVWFAGFVMECSMYVGFILAGGNDGTV